MGSQELRRDGRVARNGEDGVAGEERRRKKKQGKRGRRKAKEEEGKQSDSIFLLSLYKHNNSFIDLGPSNNLLTKSW